MCVSICEGDLIHVSSLADDLIHVSSLAADLIHVSSLAADLIHVSSLADVSLFAGETIVGHTVTATTDWTDIELHSNRYTL